MLGIFLIEEGGMCWGKAKDSLPVRFSQDLISFPWARATGDK